VIKIIKKLSEIFRNLNSMNSSIYIKKKPMKFERKNQAKLHSVVLFFLNQAKPS
jgi:hypothetical protein